MGAAGSLSFNGARPARKGVWRPGGGVAARGEGGVRPAPRPIGAAPGGAGGARPFFPPRGTNPDFTSLNFCHPRTSERARGGTPPRRLQGQERAALTLPFPRRPAGRCPWPAVHSRFGAEMSLGGEKERTCPLYPVSLFVVLENALGEWGGRSTQILGVGSRERRKKE